MKKYIFEIIIDEGNDEFWESLDGSGCDEITEVLKEQLAEWDCEIKLKKYENIKEKVLGGGE